MTASPPMADTERCERCGWPLHDRREDGCTRESCSCRCGHYPHCSCGRWAAAREPLRIEQVVLVQDGRIVSREEL